MSDLSKLSDEIAACRLCVARFAATATAHAPRPVPWFGPAPRILVAGQAPGMRVHKAGRPFVDASGDRLREWMGLDVQTFYNRDKISVLPMAFCFPGYDAKGGDLPPPPLCARTWHTRAMTLLGDIPLILPIGGHAQKWHLGAAAQGGVTTTVAQWRDHAPRVFPLPHPSWRNTGWLKRNPWFAGTLLPALRDRVQEVLT
ncbi:uracil-DNA glycosylase [Rhodovulum imhoffii]|uniref:Uracil-DNA glycosylase n=1 Tax=Rhodovulum imhoffii TaxID=365340 RepID=A0A2T5BSS4_9RHOB|nr:uracil-DNA glycosylase family protein [Rhodovulum imhoffii]MBK5934369.1 uracil-DNA glycosylase [Rhodovulum imhoffii]PTN02432.1 uracil-DNA glycosylase [Rhodovulum imhoffii]